MPPTDETLTPIVARVFHIDDVTLGDSQKNFIARYRGHIYGDSQTAYDQLSETLTPLDVTPLFRMEDGQQVVILVNGIIRPRPSNISWNIVMFVLTVFSVVYTGALNAYNGPENPTTMQQLTWGLTHLWEGLSFAIPMMAILLAHEFGHYFAGRRHGTAVTLPYYIPLPIFSPFGTMGAFIQLKNFPKNRRALLDLGIAGPLAGLIVALPILIYGLATSDVKPIETPSPNQSMILEGNSILYSTLKWAVKGELLPSQPADNNLPPWLYHIVYFVTSRPDPIGGDDVMLNGIAWAGWAGLLITALNLIPAGQLDGGHLLYVLLGKRARKFLPYILGVVALLGFVWGGWWLWGFLILIFGRFYAEPLDQITPLDGRRKALAILGLVIFILIFTPMPLRQILGPVVMP